jgi:hypothetical protein
MHPARVVEQVRHDVLKPRCPRGRAGSSPAPGISFTLVVVLAALAAPASAAPRAEPVALGGFDGRSVQLKVRCRGTATSCLLRVSAARGRGAGTVVGRRRVRVPADGAAQARPVVRPRAGVAVGRRLRVTVAGRAGDRRIPPARRRLRVRGGPADTSVWTWSGQPPSRTVEVRVPVPSGCPYAVQLRELAERRDDVVVRVRVTKVPDPRRCTQAVRPGCVSVVLARPLRHRWLGLPAAPWLVPPRRADDRRPCPRVTPGGPAVVV